MKTRSPVAETFLATLLISLLAGCSAESTVAATKAPSVAAAHATSEKAIAMRVDPAIPALTIVAHRMNEGEKNAYDRESQTTVATIATIAP